VSQAGVASEFSGAEPPSTALTDWTLRPFATGRPPLLVGLGYALAMSVGSWLIRLGIGGWDASFFLGPYFWLDVLNGVLFGYVATANWLLRCGRLRDLHDLRPVLRCDDAGWERLARSSVCVPVPVLLVSGLVGAVLMGSLPAVDPRFWEGPPPALSDPLMLFFVARMAAMGVLVGHALVTEANGTIAFARIGSNVEVDLLDTRGLAPFARAGLRSAFAWVLASSLVSLFWLGPAAGSANTGIVFGILGLVSTAFYFVIDGVHRSIEAAKREALDGLRDDIRGAVAALHSPGARERTPALADLVALQDLIERVSEWPLSVPALVRVALIVALGVGSWLGGAIVERLVERFF